jgi:hypothetical protein
MTLISGSTVAWMPINPEFEAAVLYDSTKEPLPYHSICFYFNTVVLPTRKIIEGCFENE